MTNPRIFRYFFLLLPHLSLLFTKLKSMQATINGYYDFFCYLNGAQFLRDFDTALRLRMLKNVGYYENSIDLELRNEEVNESFLNQLKSFFSEDFLKLYGYEEMWGLCWEEIKNDLCVFLKVNFVEKKLVFKVYGCPAYYSEVVAAAS